MVSHSMTMTCGCDLELNWLALFAAIATEKSPDTIMRAIGIFRNKTPKMRNRPLNDSERMVRDAEIIRLRKANVSYVEIGKIMSVSKTTAAKVWREYEALGT